MGSDIEGRAQHYEFRNLNVHLVPVSICHNFGRGKSPFWVSVSLSIKWESWAMWCPSHLAAPEILILQLPIATDGENLSVASDGPSDCVKGQCALSSAAGAHSTALGFISPASLCLPLSHTYFLPPVSFIPLPCLLFILVPFLAFSGPASYPLVAQSKCAPHLPSIAFPFPAPPAPGAPSPWASPHRPSSSSPERLS